MDEGNAAGVSSVAAANLRSSTSSSPSNKGKVVVGDCEPHVLAVDDNVVDRKLVEKLLKNSSCRVTTAENGMMALEYLGLGDDDDSSREQVSKVNLILTDYCMPGMTGYDLLKKVKGSSNMSEVPVVIMSSENVPTRIDKCLEEGAEMFILKPLKLSDVKELRRQFMQQHPTT